MNNEEKAKEVSDIYMPDTGFTREDLYDASMEMAQWKDEQYHKKLTMILNAPNEALRIEWLEALINNKL